jgi:hypothetical protein
MKKGTSAASAKSGKKFYSALILFICTALSINLTGQNIQNVLYETWTASTWQKSGQQIYTYDGSNHLTNLLTQTWDINSSAWVNSTQAIYTNNPDGTHSQENNQMYLGSAWMDISRATYTYNASKKILTMTSETYIGTWRNNQRQTNTYDGSGYLTGTLVESWDIGTSAWKNSQQITYTNNAGGYPTEKLIKSWDGVSSWVNSSRTTYTYNASNKVLTETAENWVSGNWQGSTLITNTYDGSSYLTSSLLQNWDTGTSSWKNKTKDTHTNNTDGTPSVVVYQDWDGVSSWVDTDRATYTYGGTTLVPESKFTSKITVYPNPASEMIRIETDDYINGSTYSIMDQSGKVVLKGRLTGSNSTVNISSLTNGVYFLQVGKKGQSSFKLIKNQ